MDRHGVRARGPWRRLAGALAVLGCTLGLFLLPGHARAEEWLQADSAHLVVVSNAGRTAITSFADKIETYDAFLRAYLGVGAGGGRQTRLHVYLLAHDDDVRMLWPSSGSVAGFYDHAGDEPILVVGYVRARPGAGAAASEADDTSYHEFTHFFQQAHFPAGYPGWVIEGYAQFLQTIRIEDGSVVLGHGSSSLMSSAQAAWLPWDKVLRGSTGTVARDEWWAFYGQAWLLTHYLMSDPARRDAFNRYLVDVAKGGDPVTSLTRALGTDLPTLTKQLKQYYRSPLSVQRIRWQVPAPPRVEVSTVQPARAALLLFDARGRYFVRPDDQAAFVDKVRGIAARYPGDPFAITAAARADAKYGDAARAETTLAPLLATRPDDAEALLIRARARLREADASKDAAVADRLRRSAQVDLDGAFRADPNDALMLYYAAVARQHEPDYPTRTDIAYLGNALEIEPQSQAIRLTLGEALLKANRRPEATLVLQPMLDDPHDDQGRQAAAKLLHPATAARPS